MSTVISPIFSDDLTEAVNTGKHIAWATGKRAVVGHSKPKGCSTRKYFAASTGCEELQRMTWVTDFLVGLDPQGRPRVY